MGNAAGANYAPVATAPSVELDADGPAPAPTLAQRWFGTARPAKKAPLPAERKTELEARIGTLLNSLHVHLREMDHKAKRYRILGRAQRDAGDKELALDTAKIVAKCIAMCRTITGRIGQLEELGMHLVFNNVTLESVRVMRAITGELRHELTDLGGIEGMGAALDEWGVIMESIQDQVEHIETVMEANDPTGSMPMSNAALNALLDDIPPTPQVPVAVASPTSVSTKTPIVSRPARVIVPSQ